jgi:polysaccharide pyruvyl transferase WcaK-like protein
MAAQVDTLHRNIKIGVFGHVGNKNLGDEAIIAAVIQNIRCRHTDAQIYGFTLNPEDTEKRHNITAFPIRRVQNVRANNIERIGNGSAKTRITLRQKIKSRLKTIPVVYAFLRKINKGMNTFCGALAELRFLVECYHNLKGIDLLIIAGSQQLIDYIGGPWGHTYTLFKWTLLAKAVKSKVAFVSVGAGPIYSSLGKFFARQSLMLASYRSYRDETSKAFAENLGVSGQHNLFPDLVYSLESNASSNDGSGRGALPIVGINAVPFWDEQYWLGASARNYETYIDKLASFALWVIERGYRVLFFPTQLKLDPPVIVDIKNVLKAKAELDLSECIVDQLISSFDDLVAAISMTDIVVATRFHGIVIPYVLNKPVLAIAYQRKSVDLMTQMGQSEYVVDINSFDVESLKTRFVSLEARSTAIIDEIQHKKSIFRQALQNQYDQLLGLIWREMKSVSIREVDGTVLKVSN